MKTLFLPVFCTIIILSACGTALSKERIRLATGEWPPFIARELPHHGVVMRIIKESFAAQGVEVIYAFFPWGRAEKLVEKGIWDGLAVETKNPVHYSSDIIVEDRLVFFHLKDIQFDWNRVEDLQEYRVGGVLGNTYGPELTRLENSGSLVIDRVSDEALNFRKLIRRRIDVAPMGLSFGSFILDTAFSSGEKSAITYHPRELRISGYRLSLSRKVPGNKDMLRRFNLGLQQLKTSGKYLQYIQASQIGQTN